MLIGGTLAGPDSALGALPVATTAEDQELPSESNAERAYRVIKNAVIRGQLRPGSTVSEAQLARKLGMSRTPVHQAVARLEVDGWVIITPRSGVVIAAIDPKDIEKVYETLLALEGAAVVRLASRERGRDSIDEELLEACAVCESALENGDLHMWADSDNALHSSFLISCGNHHLWRAAATVMEQSHRARLLTVELRPWPARSNEDHRKIVDAIISRKPEAAYRALEEHRRRGMDTLIPIIRAISWGSSELTV
ncbi:GntR family transcriptional regulator [Paenarthrobacter sp. NPDC089675]|uniref:GntR family transcriptional regulator n=1 Tax=Paenarthrobacter sp. NPDC089675 TaxID=3364376 RepID=UPI0037F77AE6